MNRERDIWEYLQQTSRPIVLYGMGNGAETVIKQLEKNGKRAVGVFASDGFVRGQQFCGYTVTSYTSLAEKYPEMIILVCFGSNRAEVLEYIELLGQRHTVLCPDVPVYGDNIFDHNFARRHALEIQQVYDLLGDDYSKETYQKIIEFKLSGCTHLLHSCQFEGKLFDPLTLSEEETYLDLGAYRGDTVDEFIRSVNGYKKIFAFEPNQKTFDKLCQNVKSLENVFPLHKAVSDHDGVAEIYSAGRGSSIKKKGQIVSVCSLDSFFDTESISLIKMDVEGEERAAINGARNLITQNKPKMIIAAYHRSEDIFAIPLQIHQMRSDYKIILRHFPHNLAWDTNFYFI